MEWEPTSTLQIKSRTVQSNPSDQQPSPFYGTLPSLPTNRLLHPKSQSLPQPRQAIGVPPGFFDRAANNVPRTQASLIQSPGLAQPTFFPQSDREAETGLEGMFSSVFSLSKDPVEVLEQSRPHTMLDQNSRASTSLPKPRHAGMTVARIVHNISAGVSLVSLLTWILMSYLSVSWPLIRLIITSLTAVIPVADVILDVSTLMGQIRYGPITGFRMEFCTLLLFSSNMVYGRPLEDEKKRSGGRWCLEHFVLARILSLLCRYGER